MTTPFLRGQASSRASPSVVRLDFARASDRVNGPRSRTLAAGDGRRRSVPPSWTGQSTVRVAPTRRPILLQQRGASHLHRIRNARIDPRSARSSRWPRPQGIRVISRGRVLRSATPRKEKSAMGIVVSMLMIAAGAVMRFAVTAQGKGFNVHTTGMVLRVVGAVSAVISIAFWASWGGFGRRDGGDNPSLHPITGDLVMGTKSKASNTAQDLKGKVEERVGKATATRSSNTRASRTKSSQRPRTWERMSETRLQRSRTPSPSNPATSELWAK